MLAAMALGARRPAVIFIALRARGGRSAAAATAWSQHPAVLPALPVGDGRGRAARRCGRRCATPTAMDIDLRALLPNLILFANYSLVGYFTARTQLARRPLLDGWSLSGVAMSGVFLTCALSHLVAGLMTGRTRPACSSTTSACPRRSTSCGPSTASTSDSERDWNRRPLVGRAAPLGRRSPWAEANPKLPAPNGASQSRVAFR